MPCGRVATPRGVEFSFVQAAALSSCGIDGGIDAVA